MWQHGHVLSLRAWQCLVMCPHSELGKMLRLWAAIVSQEHEKVALFSLEVGSIITPEELGLQFTL